MNLELDESQEIIKKTAHDFLSAGFPSDKIREILAEESGYDEGMWRQMADLGWMGIVIPEELEGIGGGFVDLAVLLEEMGYFAVPGPYFSTVVLGAMNILKFGDAGQKKEWLPRIARGEVRATLALTEADKSPWAEEFSVTAKDDGTGFRINGQKFYVDNAHIADLLICAAETPGGATLFLMDTRTEGIGVTLLKTTDESKYCEVCFDDVSVTAANVLGGVGEGRNRLRVLLQIAALSACARMLGGMRRVLEMTVEHVKVRIQFGQPVGAFQAVQHHCADMATDLEVSRLMTHQAVWKMDQGLDFEESVSMAKAWVGEAYARVMQRAHQCIGGIAFTAEHDLPLYSRSATGAELLFGDSDFHRERVAREIGL